MTNRRQFLQIGITATALASAAARAAAAGFRGKTALPLYKVIYDARFAASRDFAERALVHGLAVHAIEGDMTRFWYDELYYEWKRRPVAIAGLTAHGALFCFDQLGRDQGLRVVFTAEHALHADGALTHSLEGPASMLAEHARRLRNGADWSRCMADVVARCPRGKTEIVSHRTTTAAAPRNARDTGRERLYTWVIAPARRG